MSEANIIKYRGLIREHRTFLNHLEALGAEARKRSFHNELNLNHLTNLMDERLSDLRKMQDEQTTHLTNAFSTRSVGSDESQVALDFWMVEQQKESIERLRFNFNDYYGDHFYFSGSNIDFGKPGLFSALDQLALICETISKRNLSKRPTDERFITHYERDIEGPHRINVDIVMRDSLEKAKTETIVTVRDDVFDTTALLYDETFAGYGNVTVSANKYANQLTIKVPRFLEGSGDLVGIAMHFY